MFLADKSIDCRAWKAFNALLASAREHGAYNLIDRLEAELVQLSLDITADGRRLDHVRAACPDYERKILEHSSDRAAQKLIPDPASTLRSARQWLATLTDEGRANVRAAIRLLDAELQAAPPDQDRAG